MGVSWRESCKNMGCFKMDVIEMLDLVRDLAESFGRGEIRFSS